MTVRTAHDHIAIPSLFAFKLIFFITRFPMAKLFEITLGNTASLQICEAIFSAPLFNFNFIGLSWFGAQILEKKLKYIFFMYQ